MRMIDVHKRRVSLLGEKGFDLTPFGITRLVGLVRTNITINDYFMKIGEVGGDGTLYYVFWDENGTFSETSPVSTTTTPTSTLFGSIKGSSSWRLNSLVCHLSGIEHRHNNSSTAIGTAMAVDSGNIMTSPTSGKPCVYFIGANNALGGTVGFSELNNNAKFTQTLICEPLNNGNLHGLFSTSATAPRHVSLYLDKTANKLGARVVTDVDTYDLNYIDVQNDANQKNIQFTFDGDSKEIQLYLNSLIQDDVVIDGDYTNNTYRIGNQLVGTSTPITGYMPCVATHNRVLTQQEIESLNTILNQIF